MHAVRERYPAVVIGVAISFLLIVVGIPFAGAANTPSHPLSHITPTDSNLNFSNNANARAYNITGIGGIQNFFANNCGSDEAVQYIQEDGTFNCVSLSTGDVSGSGTATEVAFFANSDTITSDSNLYFDDLNYRLGIGTTSPSTALDVSGTATVGGLSGSGIVGADNLVSSYESGAAYDYRFLEVAGDTMNGNLNMSDNNITDINHVNRFFGSQCAAGEAVSQVYANGSYNCIDIDATAGDQTLEDVLGTGNRAGPYNINMDNNSIRNISALYLNQPITDGNISDSITIAASGSVHPAALTRLLRDDEIRNDTSINASGFVNSSAIEQRIAGNQLLYSSGVLGVNEGPGSGLNADTLDGTERADLNWSNTALDQNHVLISHLGAADANLNLNNYNITNLRQLSGFFATACGPGQVVDQVYADGSYSCVTVDSEVTDVWVNESGDTMSGQLNLSFSNRIVAVADPVNDQDVVTKSYFEANDDTIPDDQNLSEVLVQGNVANQSIDMAENAIQNVNSLQDGAGTDTVRFDGSNNVNIPNGNLDVSGTANVDSNGGITVSTGGKTLKVTNQDADGMIRPTGDQDLTLSTSGGAGEAVRILDDANADQDIARFKEGGNVEIPNGNLNMSFDGNITGVRELQNYFDSACPAEHAIAEIYANGTFRCIDTVTDETTEAGLPRTLTINNTANMTIDMDGNDIDSIGTLNSGGTILTVGGQLDMSGNNINLNGGWLSGDGGNEGISVDAQGQVGVNNNNPQQDLDVDGSVNMSSSGTNMELKNNGDVVITLGS